MTNERAVEILNLDLDILGQYGGETAEAYKMAIKALEAQPCEDCISREVVIKNIKGWFDKIELNPDILIDSIVTLPSVIPQYTDEEIDKAQAVEQAYVDKMVELAVEEAKRPKGKWLHIYKSDIACECSVCHTQMPITEYYHYCPNCGAYMGGAEDEDRKSL